MHLAKYTCSYAYAYRVLGLLYFNKGTDNSFEELIISFDRILFDDCYDLIWKSFTNLEKGLVINIVKSDSGKSIGYQSDKGLNSPWSRFINKHLINTEERGIIKINLPRFGEYVFLWNDED